MSFKYTQVSLTIAKKLRLKELQTQARQIDDSRNITMARQKELQSKIQTIAERELNYTTKQNEQDLIRVPQETQTISLISNCKYSNHSTYFVTGSNLEPQKFLMEAVF